MHQQLDLEGCLVDNNLGQLDGINQLVHAVAPGRHHVLLEDHVTCLDDATGVINEYPVKT